MNRGQVDVTWFQPFHLSFSLCVSNFWQKTVQYAKKSCLMKTCVTSLLWNSFTLSGIHSVIVFFSPVAQLNDLRSHLLCWLITCVTDTILGKKWLWFLKADDKSHGGISFLALPWLLDFGEVRGHVLRTWQRFSGENLRLPAWEELRCLGGVGVRGRNHGSKSCRYRQALGDSSWPWLTFWMASEDRIRARTLQPSHSRISSPWKLWNNNCCFQQPIFEVKCDIAMLT